MTHRRIPSPVPISLKTRIGLLAIAGPDVRYARFGFSSDSIRAYHYQQIMKPSFGSIEDFDLSKATVLVGELPWTQGQRPSGILVLPSSFPKAKLYALLKALFGRPKGMMSIALHPEGDPDALFKYEFSIKLPDDTRLSIMRSWLNVEVHSWGRKLQLKEVIRLFTFNFELHKEEVRKSLEDLEVYRLIINPHFRHKKMMNFFQQELKHTDPHVPTLPKTLLVTAKESTYYAKVVRAYVKEMERQNCFAVSLVMESAYTAESYLNLVLALARNDLALRMRIS
jgi:hypothetical protein